MTKKRTMNLNFGPQHPAAHGVLRLIDELESLGIVSGYSGSKAREVLVDYSYLKEIFNE